MKNGPGRRTDNQFQHLNLLLGFFPRADAKTQFLTGLIVGMLGFLATVVTFSGRLSWIILTLAIVASGLLLASLIKLYLASYPNLKGGESSLIYFNEIAKLRESTFIERIVTISEGDLLVDMAAQTWRNAIILSAKFAALKDAHKLLIYAVLPWLLASTLSMVAKQNPKFLVP